MSREWAYIPRDEWMICTACKETKQVAHFYKNNRSPTGYQRRCKRCADTLRKPRDNEKLREYSKTYRNKRYEVCLERTRGWRRKNLEYDAFRSATYRATKAQRTPKWADLNKVKEFYINCPKGYHVDHIIPLRGKLVSGLHVLENLQYLPATENLAKRNIYHVS